MHVLIAEDQASSALALRRLLVRLGHRASVASDGQTAWEMIQTGQFPVLISDWVMPRLDGLELCKKIRSRSDLSYQYIILLTSKHEQADRLEGLRAGADDFLVKPFHAEELAVRLEIAGRILGVQEALESRNRLLSALVDSDELTGAKNRRYFFKALEARFIEACGDESVFSLMILDIDNFKAYNDTFGHPAGDEVLRQAVGLIRDEVGGDGILARIGGEEFALLMPELGEDESIAACERIRAAISDHRWPLRSITASLGVATLLPSTRSPSDLIDDADIALYASKRSGRDRVTHRRDLAETYDELASPAGGPLPHGASGGGRLAGRADSPSTIGQEFQGEIVEFA